MSYRGSRQPPGTGQSRRTPKASYRPSNTAQSNRPSYSQPRESLPSRQTEQDNASLYSEGQASTIIPRDVYQPSNDAAVTAAITRINSYLQDTEVEESFNGLCKVLLSMAELPYNPYPGFARRLKQKAERFHVFSKSDEEIMTFINSPTHSSGLAYLVKAANHDVWGLRSLLPATEPQILMQYDWLLQDVTPTREGLDAEEGYSNQVTLALVGPSIFHGTFYDQPASLTIRLEYLVSGFDVTKGVSTFVQSVLYDIKYMDSYGTHIVLGVQVPRADPDEPDVWEHKFWTMDSLHDRKEEFQRAITDAVLGNRTIGVECVFKVDQRMEIYRKGFKEYVLNFLQVDERQDEDKLTTFAEFPLGSLHEGVFLKRHQAEAYLSTFMSRIDIVDSDLEQLPPEGFSNQSLATILEEDPRGQSRHSFRAGRRTRGQPNSRDSKPARVQTDGFRMGSRVGHGPHSWQITAPIRSRWQEKIVSFHPQAQIFDIAHHLLLLTLMDRETNDSGLIVELYRLLHSTAAQLYSIMEENTMLRDLVQKYQGNTESRLIYDLFVQYKTQLVDLLHGTLQERSSDMHTASQVTEALLDDIAGMEQGFTNTVPLTRKTAKLLRSVNSYCMSILVNLVEDIMPWCPKIQSLITKLREAFPERITRPQTRTKERVHHQKITLGMLKRTDTKLISTSKFTHGLEEEAIIKHDKQVISKEICMERDTAPKIVSMESVLMKYLVDTHLDEVWTEYLTDLITGSSLPPNPYPSLVSTLRRCAMRMDLCYERESRITMRLLHGSARVENAENFVWHIPGCDAHGTQSALTVLDSSHFFQIAPIAQQLINRDFMQRKGPYRVAICTCLSGHSPLYGKMAPYMTILEMHEHCYIRGPDGCWGEAIHLYSRIVWEHIANLCQHEEYPVFGAFLGDEELRFLEDDILNGKQGFAAEVERYILRRETVYVKLYVRMAWRYIPVIKHFKFHFINEEETDFRAFFRPNPAHLYQNVYFSEEKAAFHFQYGGPPEQSSPSTGTNVRLALRHIDQEIMSAKKHCDWLNVHRWLLTRNLVNQGTSHITQTWRMLHSIAGQIEYTNSLNRSLQDLVQYGIEEQAKKSQIRAEREPNDETDSNAGTVESVGCLDMSVVQQMTAAFRQKVDAVCKAHCGMAARCLAAYTQGMLQMITERDPLTKDINVVIEPQTIKVLEDIHSMLRQVQDAAAYDVHCISAEAQAALMSIEAEATTRPQSVASVHLQDPHIYQRHNVAKMEYVAVDEWLDKGPLGYR